MFEQIYFSQQAIADDVLEIIANNGPDSALEQLKSYHYPGEHECSENTMGANDSCFEKDNYLLSYNEHLHYVSLQYKCEHNSSQSQQLIWEFQLLRDLIERVLCVDYELSENMRILDDLMNLEDLDIKCWLTMNDEPEFAFMVSSARRVFKILYCFFDTNGDFSDIENVCYWVKKQLRSDDTLLSE